MGRKLGAALLIAATCAVAALATAERRHPLRRPTRPAVPRTAANLALGAGCAAAIAALEEPLCRAIARGNEQQASGIAGRFPWWMRRIAGIAAMDYLVYLWHVATHRLEFLWRFHRVHHVDPDLDMSTAARFHPLDMLVSLPWRLVQVRLSGVDRRGLALWRQFFNASILFHHANLALPARWDRRLAWLLTTPGMHAIHHSAVRSQRDSNWSSGFSIWDRLHGTLHREVAQPCLTIGVDDFWADGDVALIPSLAAPFRSQSLIRNPAPALSPAQPPLAYTWIGWLGRGAGRCRNPKFRHRRNFGSGLRPELSRPASADTSGRSRNSSPG